MGFTANVPDDVWQDDGEDGNSDNGHDAGSDDGQSAKGTKLKGYSKLLESFNSMKQCVMDFIKASSLHLKCFYH